MKRNRLINRIYKIGLAITGAGCVLDVGCKMVARPIYQQIRNDSTIHRSVKVDEPLKRCNRFQIKVLNRKIH